MKLLGALVPVLVFAVIIYQANGLCNTCSAITGLACVSNTEFKVCNQGVPQGSAITCPGGLSCSPDQTICTADPNAPKSCQKCGSCNDGKLFACTKYNAFSLCLGADSPEGTKEYVCPDNLVCSVDAKNICINPSTSGLGGTCPYDTGAEAEDEETTTEELITTTPSARDHPHEFCATIGFSGSYEVTSDTTCKQYIRCSRTQAATGQVWNGSIYQCPLATFFNATTQQCGDQKPARCP
ncbi:probable endochitinase [Eupeodes corollae]|uniref:probable endochitinase n=1 Tax=Eupeodes corollae TaxID=290404 RepID=UPI0024935431|nr:probable endochitinase [Eupeodes corollae]